MSTHSAVLPDLSAPRAQLLLALADDALVSGHRASHWTGVAPSLEEDLAFSTIAQDGINHADLWYQVLLGPMSDLRAGVDALGLGREPHGYRHAIVCERPPRDFAYTLARHWVCVHAERARLDALTGSVDVEVAALATKLVHETRYHEDHARHWFRALVHGGEEASGRLRAVLADVLPEASGLFEPAIAEDEAVDAGLFPGGHLGVRDRWSQVVGAALEGAGYRDLVPPDDATTPVEASGGRLGEHSDDFTRDVWPEMTALYRSDPGARW